LGAAELTLRHLNCRSSSVVSRAHKDENYSGRRDEIATSSSFACVGWDGCRGWRRRRQAWAPSFWAIRLS